jgi:hypothetical protein
MSILRITSKDGSAVKVDDIIAAVDDEITRRMLKALLARSVAERMPNQQAYAEAEEHVKMQCRQYRLNGHTKKETNRWLRKCERSAHKALVQVGMGCTCCSEDGH